ncbi:Type II restriction endonuclease [Pseudomonas savastanoi]|uniref:Type II restriction endonuclease n=1 Tax=Pseudomonas savastanoi TaxID=29438 RepID=A0A3M5ZU22_PSESS|nr:MULTISPECIES: type II restriction endonuclease [Pseudomonas syringae group]RMR06520.1 Type II restriction endonuclease [Pseudomonas syringae pv. helianthi]RMV10535.1 Type II restriction endonuclease [Pseudomonas savastanoi]
MKDKAVLLEPVCLKTLAAVEAHPNDSNQHEFNGVSALKSILGELKQKFRASFFVRGSDVTDEVMVTWYDARENSPDRTEFRLYFQTNQVMALASAGDNILIGMDKNKKLNFILIRT